MDTSHFFEIEKNCPQEFNTSIPTRGVEDSKDVTAEPQRIKPFNEEKRLLHEHLSNQLPYLQEQFALSTEVKQIYELTQKLKNDSRHLSDTARNNRLCMAKLKFATRVYTNANDALIQDIKSLERLLESTTTNIGTFYISKEEMYEVEAKIKKYDNEILKLKNKYPHLADKELQLPYIFEEGKELDKLKQERNELKTYIDGTYKGLSSNLSIARGQLATIKSQFEKMRGTEN